jgi:hypothetical protein
MAPHGVALRTLTTTEQQNKINTNCIKLRRTTYSSTSRRAMSHLSRIRQTRTTKQQNKINTKRRQIALQLRTCAPVGRP